jgi:hypothetical protein
LEERDPDPVHLGIESVVHTVCGLGEEGHEGADLPGVEASSPGELLVKATAKQQWSST